MLAEAKGDFVWLVFEEEKKRKSKDPSKTYFDTSLEVLRLQNGKVQEHWDSQMKMPGSGKIADRRFAQAADEWNTGKLSKEEEQTLALAKTEMKDMLQYAHHWSWRTRQWILVTFSTTRIFRTRAGRILEEIMSSSLAAGAPAERRETDHG